MHIKSDHIKLCETLEFSNFASITNETQIKFTKHASQQNKKDKKNEYETTIILFYFGKMY